MVFFPVQLAAASAATRRSYRDRFKFPPQFGSDLDEGFPSTKAKSHTCMRNFSGRHSFNAGGHFESSPRNPVLNSGDQMDQIMMCLISDCKRIGEIQNGDRRVSNIVTFV